ncbi:hypothetical protein ABIE33_006550 [Ensifer sp. 4252]
MPAFLQFLTQHRLAVLILLRGSQGTRYAHVPPLMTREMLRLASRPVTDRHSDEALTPLLFFTLDRTIDTIGDILASQRYAPSIAASNFLALSARRLAGTVEPGGITRAIARRWSKRRYVAWRKIREGRRRQWSCSQQGKIEGCANVRTEHILAMNAQEVAPDPPVAVR